MVSVFGWPDPNTGFDQSEHALYTCYFINSLECDLHTHVLTHVIKFNSCSYEKRAAQPDLDYMCTLINVIVMNKLLFGN
jgi:hypothetical protein